ncbi:single-stranded-DNA-specific exonuclease RecJ [Cohnella endophytica]|uniref:Single-stranded-DNA-specific exonuclease RecJ n=1 Tax=Cohnella endophytica TaxID=2419778 RepID=A0A494XX39_9BACL|nr:single-stranded-DNA-specific exonuclease RecJ [Cohnella endophytica]RKP54274.1 single-stranded-DNA-specific exonuclease RecJ [Cohnella endophytica]
MLKSKYRWDLPKLDAAEVAELSAGLKVDRLVAGVLAGRGWKLSRETSDFLHPGEDQLLDPYGMKGMSAATERISRAIRAGERIRVYGDYDADGVTSTALMIRLLTELGAIFDTYIPHRSREGYGLNIPAIDLASQAGVKLIVTVDNGISAVEQIAYAASIGIDVVVTDHHEPPEKLPDAVALVNPKQKDCPYPFKGLCGAGVVFKLAHAMLGRPVLEYADLAAIGTIADLMPLVGENRIIARLGLEQMRRLPIPGIRALSKVASVKHEEMSSGRVGFSLAPRLNAGGRLEHADTAVRLLAAADIEEAERLAEQLDRLNVERQELVEITTAEADELWQDQLSSQGAGRGRNVIVLAKAGWNAGIAGLVASKLVERYYRPAIVLATDAATGLCKGSARSIDGFDLHAALTDCADLLDHFGGHQAAAGMTLSVNLVESLAERLHEIAGQRISEEDWQPKRRVDLMIAMREATIGAVDQLASMEPFGNGNPTPRVVMRDVVIRESRTMGKEGAHLRVTVEQDGRSIDAVAFGMGNHRERLEPGIRIDVLGELSVNEWNGNRKVQLMLQDYRSEHLFVHDRRGERDLWSALDSDLRETTVAGSVVCCASPSVYAEAVGMYGHRGAIVCLYQDLNKKDAQTARSDLEAEPGDLTQMAATSERGVQAMEGIRHLILAGLPQDAEHVRSLRRRIAGNIDLERITVFSAGQGSRLASERASRVEAFPDRKQFGEVYALCRKKGSWLESPDGFQLETAQKTGWPLATIRMMHEVFIELGFILADGASRKIVAEPPRRELDVSPRYRRAREVAEGQNLAVMTSEQLERWLRDGHAGMPL